MAKTTFAKLKSSQEVIKWNCTISHDFEKIIFTFNCMFQFTFYGDFP